MIDLEEISNMNDEEVTEALKEQKDSLHRKVKMLDDLTEAKKDMAKGYNEQIKVVKADITELLDALRELENRARSLQVLP